MVPPRRRGSGFEAIHGALVLALLVHALGLAACWLRTAGPQDQELRVLAPVELVDSLPPPPPKPIPIRVPAPPPPPPAVVEPVALPAVVAGVPVSSGAAAAAPPVAPRLPTASRALGTAAPPALPGPAAPRSRPPREWASPRVRPGEASPLSSASPAGSAPAPRPAAPTPSPAAGGAGSHRWAWVPGPEQPRPVSQGAAPPGEALGRARAWVELRIPANDGRAVAPSESRVLEIELLDEVALPKADREARVRARAEAVARSSRWKPGTRDGQPADYTIQLFLEFGGR